MGRSTRPAKVTAPRLARIHPRPRLFRRLDRALPGRVVWISGPPGAGKTVLAASWLARLRGRRVAWLRVDAADSDPAGFFAWLVEAMPPAVAKALPRFGPTHVADTRSFARAFGRALAAAARSRLVIAIDDYSELTRGSAVHEVLRELVTELAGAVGVVVTSRTGAPAALSRFRANGELEVVAGDELLLNAREAAAVARARGVTSMSGGDLVDRTQGWAAGVVLMLAARRRRGDDATPQEVFDLLATEVLDRLPRRMQDLLVRVAVAPRVSAEAAVKLSGDPEAAEALAELAAGGWFVQRHAGPAPVFELHPLMRDVLAARARGTLPLEVLRALLLDAGRATEREGDVPGAVSLYRQADAVADLARVVGEQARELLGSGRASTLLGWIELLPAPLVEATPWLRYWRGAARAIIAPTQARGDLEAAFNGFVQAADPIGAHLAWAALVQIVMFGEQDDHTELDRWLAELEALRAAFPVWPGPEIEALVTVAATTASGLRRPSDPVSIAWRRRAAEIARSSPDARIRLDVGTGVVAAEAVLADDLERARATAEAIRPLIVPGVAPAQELLLAMAECNMALHSGDIDELHAVCSRGLSVGEAYGVHQWDPTFLNMRCFAELARDQLARAAEACAELGRVGLGGSRLHRMTYHGCACALAIRRGKLAMAIEQGRTSIALATEAGSVIPALLVRVPLAFALERSGVVSLSEALSEARELGVRSAEFGTLAAAALIALDRGDEDAAARTVADAFALGRRTGCRWAYFLSRAEHAELCALALERDIEPAYALETIRVCQLPPVPRARLLTAWPWPTRVEVLGGLDIAGSATTTSPRKQQKKSLELLRLLVAHGERGATLDRLADALWPDIDGDTAHHSLETTIYRLRKLLGEPAAVVRRGGRVVLDGARVFVDAWAVEELGRREATLRARGDPAGARRAAAAATALYTGDLLPDDDLPAVRGRRDQLRALAGRLRAAAVD